MSDPNNAHAGSSTTRSGLFKNLVPYSFRDLVDRTDPDTDKGRLSDFKPTMAPRDDVYYDENLQPINPSLAVQRDGVQSLSVATRHSISEGPLNPVMVLDIVSKPSAVVIGAGLPGVHMAYELARKGFQVDVYDSQSTTACGNTPFMFPIVGAPFLPYAFDCFSKARTRGSGPNYLTLPGCFDPFVKMSSTYANVRDSRPLTHFAKGWRSVRTGKGGVGSVEERREAIIAQGTKLSKDSALKVRAMLQEHPELRAATLAQYRYNRQQVKGGGIASSSSSASALTKAERSFWAKWFGFMSFGKKEEVPQQTGATIAATSSSSSAVLTSSTAAADDDAHLPLINLEDDSELTIKPLRWTQSLAALCSEQYGVRFHFDTKMIAVRPNDLSSDNFVSGITVKKKDATFTQNVTADIYVLAAGVSNPLAMNALVNSYPLLVTKGTAAIFETRRRGDVPPANVGGANALSLPEAIAKAIRGSAVSSSSSSPLFGNKDGFYFFPGKSALRYNVSEVPFSKKTSAESGMIVGGQTLNTELSPFTQRGEPMDVFYNVLDTLFASISSNGAAEPTLAAALSELRPIYKGSRSAAAAARDFHCYSYFKTVSADGLPLASRIGPYFNTFVIGGFGDHSPALAPATADRLVHMIANPRDTTIPEPFPMRRCDPDNVHLNPMTRLPTPEELHAKQVQYNRAALLPTIERKLNKYITHPVDAMYRRLLRAIVVMPYAPYDIRSYIFLNLLSAEDEEMLTGMRASVVHAPIPQITPDTVLAPPSTAKDQDLREGVRVFREDIRS